MQGGKEAAKNKEAFTRFPLFSSGWLDLDFLTACSVYFKVAEVASEDHG